MSCWAHFCRNSGLCHTGTSNKQELHCVTFIKQHFQVLVRAPSRSRRRSPGSTLQTGQERGSVQFHWDFWLKLQHILSVLQCAESVLVSWGQRTLDTSPRTSSLCPPFWSHAGGDSGTIHLHSLSLPPPTKSAIGLRKICRIVSITHLSPLSQLLFLGNNMNGNKRNNFHARTSLV